MEASVAEDAPPRVPPKSIQGTSSEAESCPTCGHGMALDIHDLADAKKRIAELEAQVQCLTEKATAAGRLAEAGTRHFWRGSTDKSAVHKYAQYEDQIRALQAGPTPSLMKLPRSYTAPTLEPSHLLPDDPRSPTANHAGAQTPPPPPRFSFFTGRRPASNIANLPPSPPPSAAPGIHLINELERERALRTKAEDRARTVDLEIEELSVQLFSQANEMVAEERRARAKLEERVEMLEKKDKDKAARLERLEKAVVRVARIKVMLDEPDKTTSNGLDAVSGILTPPMGV